MDNDFMNSSFDDVFPQNTDLSGYSSDNATSLSYKYISESEPISDLQNENNGSVREAEQSDEKTLSSGKISEPASTVLSTFGIVLSVFAPVGLLLALISLVVAYYKSKLYFYDYDKTLCKYAIVINLMTMAFSVLLFLFPAFSMYIS